MRRGESTESRCEENETEIPERRAPAAHRFRFSRKVAAPARRTAKTRRPPSETTGMAAAPTLTSNDEVSLEGSGSGSLPRTDAVLKTRPSAPTRTIKVTVAESEGKSDPSEHTTTVVPLHEPCE